MISIQIKRVGRGFAYPDGIELNLTTEEGSNLNLHFKITSKRGRQEMILEMERLISSMKTQVASEE